MELQIGKEILNLADRCTHQHRCLSGVLSEPLNGSQRFICHDNGPCAYKFPFGGHFFCTCPVRKAIYEKYSR